MPPYDPTQMSALLGLPDALCNDRLSSMQSDEQAWTENRRHLCNFLRQAERLGSGGSSGDRMTSRQLWKILVPFRPQLTALQRQPNAAHNSYEWIIDSLDGWFSRAPLSRIEYIQWSIGGLIDVMLAKELGARSAQFSMANKVLQDVLQNCTPHDLSTLRNALQHTSTSQKSPP